MKKESIIDELNWFENPGNKTGNASDWPKISLITPSFNQGKFIEQTILSVLNQNYPNLEYIVIDGGSTDNSVEIIKKHESRLKYWESEKDKGQTDALNKGFAHVTGEIFNWINSDDILAADSLWKVGSYFKNNPDKKCFAGKEIRFLGGQMINVSFGTSIMETVEQTLIASHIDQPSTFFRTVAIKHAFPLDTGLRYCMDNQMWLNFLISNGIDQCGQSNEILAYFRYHDDSKTFINAPKFKMELIRLHEELDNYFSTGKSSFFRNKDVLIDSETFQRYAKVNAARYNLDESLVLRESAAYYQYMGLRKPALYFSSQALKKNPFKLINHKYFWSIRIRKK